MGYFLIANDKNVAKIEYFLIFYPQILKKVLKFI